MTSTATEATLAYVETSLIQPNPENPRKVFDEQAQSELVESVRQHGIQTPLRLQEVEGSPDVGYMIVAGERRWRAAVALGLDRVPAIVVEANESIGVDALVENLVREDLNPIEEGDAYRALAESGKTPAEIANLVSRSEARVEQRMLLAGLPILARDAVATKELGIGDAEPLAHIAARLPLLADALAWAAANQAGWRAVTNPWSLYFNLDRTVSAQSKRCEICEGEGGVETGDEETGEEWVDCEGCGGSGEVPVVPDETPEVPEFFAWPVGGYGSVPLAEMMIRQLEPEARDRMIAARDKAQAFYDSKKKGGYYEPVPQPVVSSDLRDVANAAGVVQELAHGSVISDPAWISEFLPDAYEAEVEGYINPKERAKAKRAAKAGGESAQSSMSDQEREERAKEREQAKAARAKARKFNEDLGIQIQKELGEVPVTTEAMKLLVSTILNDTKRSDYNGTRGSGHALFQRFTGVVPTETTKAGDLKVARSAEDRKAFVDAAYDRVEKELSKAKTPEQALGVLVRFLAHGLADLSGLPMADLNEMFPYKAKGWRKFVTGRLPAPFRRRIPKANGIPGRSFGWGEND